MKSENSVINRLLLIWLCVFASFIKVHCCVVHEIAYLIVAINISLCCRD